MWPPFWIDALEGSGGGGGTVGSGTQSGLPKLEGQIIVPTGGWDVGITEDPLATDYVLVPAGRYYLNSTATDSLAYTLVTLLNASSALAGTYALTSDDDYDNSTGRTTISVSGGSVTSFSITWSTTALRDALGFTGTCYGATTYTSTNSSPFLWLPNVRRAPAMVPDGVSGLPVTDLSVTVSPGGVSKALQWSTRRVDRMEFAYLLGRKTWVTYETVVNESLEAFYLAAIGKGRRYRYHPNRATDTTYVSYRPLGGGDLRTAPEASSPKWTTSAYSSWHYGPSEVIGG